MGAKRNSLLGRRPPVRNAHASRSPGGYSVGVRSPVLPDFERRGGRRLARQSGRVNKVPATNAGRLRPSLLTEIAEGSATSYFAARVCLANSVVNSFSFSATNFL